MKSCTVGIVVNETSKIYGIRSEVKLSEYNNIVTIFFLTRVKFEFDHVLRYISMLFKKRSLKKVLKRSHNETLRNIEYKEEVVFSTS